MGLLLPPDDFEEYKSYLEELIADYERLVENIGNNGVNAPLLLHYRSEIEETLRELEEYDDIAPFLEPFYEKLRRIDDLLLQRAKLFLKEIGGPSKLKHYQWSLRPPKEHWWWYLDSQVKLETSKRSPLEFLGKMWRGFERWLGS